MLTRVDVQSENPFFLNIRDARPDDSIIVEKIEGLGPPDIDLFMGDYARDGGFYSGRRVPPRDVTFTLRYNPNYRNNESVSGLRNMLYKAFLDPFPTADNTNFVLHDDSVADRLITGYTSKFEGDLFSDETIAQISVRCPNPYIIDTADTILPAAGPSFPFAYHGNAETGLVIQATILSSTETVKLELNGTIMTFNLPFQAGDRLLVSTVRGSRYVRLVRTLSGTDYTINILYSLQSSVWLTLHGTAQVVKVYGATSDDVVANLNSVTYRVQYWGI